MFIVNKLIVWLQLIALSLAQNEIQGIKKYIRSKTFLYDQMLLIHNNIPSIKEDINKEQIENCHFFLNLSITINLEDEINKALKKVNKIPNLYSPNFLINKNNLPQLASMNQIDKNYISDNSNSLTSVYNIDLYSETWTQNIAPVVARERESSGSSFIVMGDQILLFGGKSRDLGLDIILVTHELYRCKTNPIYCTEVKRNTEGDVPPNAYHSATNINNDKMIILGGIPYEKSGLSQTTNSGGGIASYHASTKADLQYAYIFGDKSETWSTKETVNYNSKTRAGHTATYIPKLNSILVYGGTDKVNEGSNLYSDIQILNLETWEWVEINTYYDENTKALIGRAWHSAELIGDKIVFFYGSYEADNKLAKSVMAIDLNTLDFKKKQVMFVDKVGPALKKEGEDFNQIFNDQFENRKQIESKKSQESINYGLILGSTFGSIGALALIFILYIFIKRYRRNKMKDNVPEPLVLLPRFDSNLPILTPSQPNSKQGDEQQIWELDSHYANSIYSPNFKVKEEIEYELNLKRSESTLDHNRTLVKRRWSLDPTILGTTTKFPVTDIDQKPET